MRSTLLALVALGSSACFTFVDFELGNSGAAGQGGSGAAGLGGVGGLGGAGVAGGAGGLGGVGGDGLGGEGGTGGMVVCESGLTVCGGGCVDTLIDVAHCGACDHDCGGGGCLMGACQALELASFPAMHGLLLDDTNNRVFFATSNFLDETNVVGAVSKGGGGVDELAVAQPAVPYLALAGSRLYFTTWNPGSVRSVDIAPPASVPFEEVALDGSGFGMQLIDDQVLYVDFYDGLFSIDPAEAPNPALRVSHPNIRHFLFTQSDIVFTSAGSAVKRYVNNMNVIEDLTSANDPWDIVQDEAYYYFSEQPGTLKRIDKTAAAGGPAIEMANGLGGGTRGLALDDDYVYVVSGTDVVRVNKAPPFDTTFVATAATGTQIAVDEKFIYWTNIGGGGSLMKIAKPL